MIRVVVTGAAGRMGREVLRAISSAQDMVLTAAVDPQAEGRDAGDLAGIPALTGISVRATLAEVLEAEKPDVLVDFTVYPVGRENALLALKNGVRPVIGTTGFAAEEINEIIVLSRKMGIGGVIAPNFAIGALLMIRFAAMAAKYFPDVEIIELHHDRKLDAPSGTALRTAQEIISSRGEKRTGLKGEEEKLPGARGGEFPGGIKIHSVRLPGLVAHQEVIFGGIGQTLTIRHDSLNRESFMPGVLLAVRRVMDLREVVYGLENILFAE